MSKLTSNDFASNVIVKWCPGCGDYAILTSIKRAMAEIGIEKEKYVVVSGIGCSSRFPYYVSTYGYHTIHGRAIPVATGVKLSNPDLSVFVVTGDGDAMSIGGNHLIHGIRRNIGIKVFMFNNRIYALTKGQASPTTLFGSKTKTTPEGNIDNAFNPINFAISLGSPFVARCIDTEIDFNTNVIKQATISNGFAFVEILQKCVVFTDNEFDIFKSPQMKDEILVKVENGKPLIFGKNKNKAIVIKSYTPQIIEFEPSNPPSDLTIYDSSNYILASIISSLMPPDFPLPIGIIYKINKRSYEDMYYSSVKGKEYKNLEDVIGDGIYEIG
ncbi:MAG: 2-oxoacid:ferredoxin oxidoreductase subunit beta [Elusimicrobiales bacterium]|nr:2-oxoacid:ferredoxin oxidoreductase subunit beta [Elusimicrobiales bacterium]